MAITLLGHAMVLALLWYASTTRPETRVVAPSLSVFDLPLPPKPEAPPEPPLVLPPPSRTVPNTAGGDSPRGPEPRPEAAPLPAVELPRSVDNLPSPPLALADLAIPTLGGSQGFAGEQRGGGGGGAGTGAGRGRGGGSGDGDGPGDGGQAFFLPRWVVNPGSAELGPVTPKLMRKKATPGYGMIACQSKLPQAVRNCRVVGEHPKGSGYGVAARRASPRFRVWPPEVDGEPVDGAWMLIRIDWVYT